jgi:hypothetical protein
MNQVQNNPPFLLIQKPQELIKLFEGLIDKKIKEIAILNQPSVTTFPTDNSPFLSTKEVQKIFNVSRQTINDWRRSELLLSFKIKSRRYYYRGQVQALQQKWLTAGK